MLCGMDDPSLTPEPSAPFVQTKLGRALVTGGSGFVGANLVTELLDRGHQVRSFDRAPYLLAAHPRLEVVQGDICDPQTVAAAVEGVDTIFHTAAIINLMGGASVTDEYRQRSFAINVNGTKNLVHAAQAAAVKKVRLHRIQQCGDERPAALRRRRNPPLHRTLQRPLHRDKGCRRAVCLIAERR